MPVPTTTIEGIVDYVESKPMASGKTKHSLKIGSVYYGFFDENPGAKVGDRVSFQAKQSPDGRYWNGRGCRVVGGTVGTNDNSNPNGPAANGPAANGPAANSADLSTNVRDSRTPEGDDERQDRIMRQNASSTAGHIVAALIHCGALKVSSSDPVFDAVNKTKQASEMIFLLSKHGYGTKFESRSDSGVDDEIGF